MHVKIIPFVSTASSFHQAILVLVFWEIISNHNYPLVTSLHFLGFSKVTRFPRQRVFIILSLLWLSFLTLFCSYACAIEYFLFWRRRREQSCSQLRTWPIVVAGIRLTSFLNDSLHSSFLSDCHRVLNWGFSENDSTVSIMTPRPPSWMARVYLELFFPVIFTL